MIGMLINDHFDHWPVPRRCGNCEYYDNGDCLNSLAPWFQTEPDSVCKHFYPDTSRWPSDK